MTRISRRKFLGATATGVLGTAAGCTGNLPGQGGNSVDGPVEVWNEPNHFDHMEAAAETFNSENDKQVEPVERSQIDELTDQVLLVLQGDNPSEMPGATIIRSQFLRRAARLGGVENLNGLMEEYVDSLFPAARTKHRVDGDWYSTPQDLGPTLWFYNRDLFDQAGLPTNPEDVANDIQTWEDFRNAAETMENEVGAKMFAATATESVVPVELLGMMGGVGPFYDAEGNFKFDKPGNVRAMNVLKDLMPYAENTWMFQGDGSFWSAYKNEEVASMPYPSWAVGFMRESLPDQSGKWRVTKLPYHPDDPRQRRSGNLGGEPIMIPARKGSGAKQVAKNFSETWNLSEVGFNAKLEAGVFPAIDIQDASALENTDEFFGGQRVNQAMADAARAGGPSRYAPNGDVETEMLNATRKILANDAPVEETLTEHHNKMLEDLNENDKQIEVNA